MTMKKTQVASVEVSVENETLERIFARMCQLIDSKGEILVEEGKHVDPTKKDVVKSLRIPFTFYDETEREIINSGFLDESPDFFTQDIKQRIILMRIIESFTKEERTTMKDLIGAVINPYLCMGKTIATTEYPLTSELIVNLSITVPAAIEEK